MVNFDFKDLPPWLESVFGVFVAIPVWIITAGALSTNLYVEQDYIMIFSVCFVCGLISSLLTLHILDDEHFDFSIGAVIQSILVGFFLTSCIGWSMIFGSKLSFTGFCMIYFSLLAVGSISRVFNSKSKSSKKKV